MALISFSVLITISTAFPRLSRSHTYILSSLKQQTILFLRDTKYIAHEVWHEVTMRLQSYIPSQVLWDSHSTVTNLLFHSPYRFRYLLQSSCRLQKLWKPFRPRKYFETFPCGVDYNSTFHIHSYQLNLSCSITKTQLKLHVNTKF